MFQRFNQYGTVIVGVLTEYFNEPRPGHDDGQYWFVGRRQDNGELVHGANYEPFTRRPPEVIDETTYRRLVGEAQADNGWDPPLPTDLPPVDVPVT